MTDTDLVTIASLIMVRLNPSTRTSREEYNGTSWMIVSGLMGTMMVDGELKLHGWRWMDILRLMIVQHKNMMEQTGHQVMVINF